MLPYVVRYLLNKEYKIFWLWWVTIPWAKTRANVVVALGVNSSLAIQANTDDCSEYKIFLQLTYTQPYNQSFDYCQRPSEMWYYSELAADFNRQMSTMPSSDKEKCNGKTCEITVSAGWKLMTVPDVLILAALAVTADTSTAVHLDIVKTWKRWSAMIYCPQIMKSIIKNSHIAITWMLYFMKFSITRFKIK